MQKDVHFYLTYALCRKSGIPAKDARTIAWADQYTDELTKADLHGMQTQSDTFGNWDDRQIQLSVLVPFHFVPGNDRKHPWKTTRDSKRVQTLVNLALETGNLFQLGIALHALQDTFSHEGFSGWREPLNACYSWYYIQSNLPNVGHAEMLVAPDVANYEWTDPRDGRTIDNKKRTMAAAERTYGYLAQFQGRQGNSASWKEIEKQLAPIFKLPVYDDRKKALRVMSGTKSIRFSAVNKLLLPRHKSAFVEAANNHLAEAMKLFSGLPRLN